jgi:hypothetical protein
MAFAMAPLLIHDIHVPIEARNALRAAYETAPPRAEMLLSAALILHHKIDLDCRDALELVGLPEEARRA